MNTLLALIDLLFYYLVGVDWIVSPVGETCQPVPIYIVTEDGR